LYKYNYPGSRFTHFDVGGFSFFWDEFPYIQEDGLINELVFYSKLKFILQNSFLLDGSCCLR